MPAGEKTVSARGPRPGPALPIGSEYTQYASRNSTSDTPTNARRHDGRAPRGRG